MSGRDIPRNLLDRFTSIDEKLKETNDHLRKLRKQNDKLDSLISAINQSGSFPDVAAPRTAYIDLSHYVSADVATDDPETEDRSVPFDGEITSIIIGFNDGSSGKAGLGLDLENVDGSTEDKLFPFNEDDDYFAVNDFSEKLDAGFTVSGSQTLVGRFANNDASNAHYLTLMVGVEEDI